MYKLSRNIVTAIVLMQISCTGGDNKRHNPGHGIDNNAIYYFEPSVSELSGRVVVSTFWGPPGYGEDTTTDIKETVYILKLNTPVSVQADKNNELNTTKESVNEIQFAGKQNIMQFSGMEVIVQGTLFAAHTGHHYKEVLLNLIAIKKK